GTFDPQASVSREEVASLIARAYVLITETELATGTDAFTDDTGSVHEADINAVAAEGWVNGVGGGLFLPQGQATRAQFSSMIVRMLSTRVAAGDATVPSA